MAIKKLNPYLMFDGTAAKAIELYVRALGAKVEHVGRFSEAPGMNFAPEHKERVMHGMLRIGDGVIMLSDSMPGTLVSSESNTHVVVDFDDPEDMARKFDALAAGGKVTMPLQDAFWGAKFGMLTDAFGIRWMFNCDTNARS